MSTVTPPTQFDKPAPIMFTGKYKGIRLDQIPNSYLRWMLTQDFPTEFMDAAKKKINASIYDSSELHLSRHAIDVFSKRFITIWLESESEKGDDGEGLATFMTRLAERAWLQGRDVSKNRHEDDGIIKELFGLRWVFARNSALPDYKDVITVTEA